MRVQCNEEDGAKSGEIMEITKAIVVEGQGPDYVMLETTINGPIYPFDQPLCLSFQAAAGTGVQYVIKNFGIMPEHVRRNV